MQGYEARLKKLLEELALLRKMATEKEEFISTLRIQVQETSSRVVNVKVLLLCHYISLVTSQSFRTPIQHCSIF